MMLTGSTGTGGGDETGARSLGSLPKGFLSSCSSDCLGKGGVKDGGGIVGFPESLIGPFPDFSLSLIGGLVIPGAGVPGAGVGGVFSGLDVFSSVIGGCIIIIRCFLSYFCVFFLLQAQKETSQSTDFLHDNGCCRALFDQSQTAFFWQAITEVCTKFNGIKLGG
jgi:hypothetical protein